MRTFRCIPVILITIALLTVGYAQADAREGKDSITAWKQWKSIDTAIALRPLDGPDDIIEKAEIIDDRIDELSRENDRLNKEIDLHRKNLVNLRNQREVLQDLADIRMGGDSQTRQRLQNLAERIRRGENLLKLHRESVLELEKELTRMKKLAATFREKARLLRLKEGGAQ